MSTPNITQKAASAEPTEPVDLLGALQRSLSRTRPNPVTQESPAPGRKRYPDAESAHEADEEADRDLASADSYESELSYPILVCRIPGRAYEAQVGQHTVIIDQVPRVPGFSWSARVKNLGLVGGAWPAPTRFYWSPNWPFSFHSPDEALLGAVALLAVDDTPTEGW